MWALSGTLVISSMVSTCIKMGSTPATVQVCEVSLSMMPMVSPTVIPLTESRLRAWHGVAGLEGTATVTVQKCKSLATGFAREKFAVQFPSHTKRFKSGVTGAGHGDG